METFDAFKNYHEHEAWAEKHCNNCLRCKAKQDPPPSNDLFHEGECEGYKAVARAYLSWGKMPKLDIFQEFPKCSAFLKEDNEPQVDNITISLNFNY